MARIPRYSAVSAEDAIAAFAPRDRAEPFCDAQFAVTPDAVLCFVTVGDPMSESHCVSPTRISWRPRRLDYAPADEVPWLPTSVREVWGPNGKKIKEHHIFIRAPGDDRFVYAGGTHLGSYGGGAHGFSADFRLDEKLPRELWLRLGGYPGWSIDLNHRSFFVNNGDLRAFEPLLAELKDQEFSHLWMTRYDEDVLALHTNILRGFLMYLPRDDDAGAAARDDAVAGDPPGLETFKCACGIDLEYSAERTLPRVAAIEAVVEFFRTEALPPWIRWEAD